MKRFFLGVVALSILFVPRWASCENQAEFVAALTDQAEATYADGVRAMAVLLSGNPTVPGFDEAKGLLLGKKVVKKDWKVAPNAPLTKGKLAYMLFKTADLKPGLGDLLFGLSEKTALEECYANDLMGKGRGDQKVGEGLQLVMSFQQVAAYRDRMKKSRATDLVSIDLDAPRPGVSAEKMEAQNRLLTALSAGVRRPDTPITPQVKAVRGPVWVRLKDKGWEQAGDGTPVPPGSDLLTGVDAQAQLSFPDGTVMLLKSLTQLSMISATSGKSSQGTYYVVRAASEFGTVRVKVGTNGFLSCIQVGSPTSYVTGLEGAFEQIAAGTISDTIYAGSRGRISVVHGSW